MRIHFDNVNFRNTSGPNSFAYRLAESLANDLKNYITDKSHVYDIFLTFIESSYMPLEKAKTILRLDGIWFKEEDFDANNELIKTCYDKYEHVIFQSNFDKEMCFKHFGPRNNCHVIHNGIKIEKFKPYSELSDDDTYNFVCAASWHGQKRLVDNIKLFQNIRKQILEEKGKKSKLIILGEGEGPQILAKIQKDNLELLHNVIYLGQRDHQECLRLYATCTAMIHMAWLDHCPNVVVEALSQNCPVICNDSGGTNEIVKENGLIIPETKPYNYELADYDNPYEIELPEKIDLDKLLSMKVDSSHLNILDVAKKYMEVFEK